MIPLAVLLLHSDPCFTGQGKRSAPFMIEGIMPKQFPVGNAWGGSFFIESWAVPYAVLGFRCPWIAFGVGVTYFGMGDHTYDSGNEIEHRESSSNILVMPRLEIVVAKSRKGWAEAYVTTGLGAGISLKRSKSSDNFREEDESEVTPVIGLFAGLGGRYFFGGGPFSLGMEFGWNGMFLNDREFGGDDTINEWYVFNSIYAALVGQFVFR